MKKIKLRELSPVVNLPVEQYVKMIPPEFSEYLRKIRKQKRKGTRPRPSAKLIGESKVTTAEYRIAIMDKVASLVDERLFGRHEMCKQFAVLMQRALVELGYDAKALIGEASYENGFQWEHSWVLVENEIIDGNADSMRENPAVPPNINPRPYWGIAEKLPTDRSFITTTEQTEWDPDIEEYWWPDLKEWLASNKPK